MGDDSDKTKDDNSAKAAAQRLHLISSHVAPKSKPKRSNKNRDTELPVDWSDVLGELDLVRKFARTPKYETTGYVRQKEAGKLWVRERIELLLDPGTFEEVGSAAGTATWSKPPGPKHSVVEEEKEVVTDFTPSNNVQGMFTLCNLSVHTLGLTVLLQALAKSVVVRSYSPLTISRCVRVTPTGRSWPKLFIWRSSVYISNFR